MYNFRFVMVFVLWLSSNPLAAQPYKIASHEKPLKENTQTMVQQTGWFYGAFLSHQSSYYKGIKNDTLALPVIGYKSYRFSFLGPRASYRLNDDKHVQASALVVFKPIGFKARDSKFLNGMSTRRDSLFGGFNASIKQEKLSYKFSYLHDLQNRSRGQDIELGASYFHNIGPFFITPNISLNYWDSAYTDYYFGVRDNESNSDRNTYKPSFAVNPSIGLNLATPIFFKGFTRANFSHHWLGSSIHNSPIIETHRHWKMSISFTRFF